MILNARQNSFIVDFPVDFFNKEIQDKYTPYFRNLILPYKTLPDFMASTIQGIDWPGFEAALPEQTGLMGKRRDNQSSKPIADMFNREIKVTFKLTDAYLNYFIFLDNALNYMDPQNVAPENLGTGLGQAASAPIKNDNHPFFHPMRLTLLNNEGYAVVSIIFNRPMLKGLTPMTLSYSSNSPKFTTFAATFRYYNFDMDMEFGS